MNTLCIGLFGTCGGSTWRTEFEQCYRQQNITWFNPQVDDWTPDCAVVEAEHLANDRIVVFPITAETYAEGSLSEVGFSILNAIKLDDRRHFIVLIEQALSPELLEDAVRAKASLRARALVTQHLKKLRLDGLYVVDSLEQALTVSLACYHAEQLLQPVRALAPHRAE